MSHEIINVGEDFVTVRMTCDVCGFQESLSDETEIDCIAFLQLSGDWDESNEGDICRKCLDLQKEIEL